MSLTQSVCDVLARLGLHVLKVGHSASLSFPYTLKQTSTAGPGRFHYFLYYSGFVLSASQPLLHRYTFPCTTGAIICFFQNPEGIGGSSCYGWIFFFFFLCVFFYQKKNKKIQQRIPPPLLLLLLFTPSQAER